MVRTSSRRDPEGRGRPAVAGRSGAAAQAHPVLGLQRRAGNAATVTVLQRLTGTGRSLADQLAAAYHEDDEADDGDGGHPAPLGVEEDRGGGYGHGDPDEDRGGGYGSPGSDELHGEDRGGGYGSPESEEQHAEEVAAAKRRHRGGSSGRRSRHLRKYRRRDLLATKHSKKEFKRNNDFLNSLLFEGTAFFAEMIIHGFLPEYQGVNLRDQAVLKDIREQVLADPDKVRLGLEKVWGWSPEQIARHYRPGRRSVKNRMKVKNLAQDPTEQQKYEVSYGSRLTGTASGVPLDTRTMVSKVAGSGWGIFVMDRDGKLYVGQHQVGLFHHSSFTGGGRVAAAGEIAVRDGAVVGITNKSGHYMPNAKHLQRFVRRLAATGHSIAGVQCRIFFDPKLQKPAQVIDAADLARTGAVDADGTLKL